MEQAEYTDFLKWALPRLDLRWAGYRRVKSQVCKRLARRLSELGLTDLTAYRRFLEATPSEWRTLETFCRITISRFYRNKDVFDRLREEVIPALLQELSEDDTLRCWSAGCASGEEAYTLSLLCRLGLRDSAIAPQILATDIDPVMLDRARRGCYPLSSLRDLPADWREEAFVPAGEEFCIKERFRTGIEFHLHDVRKSATWARQTRSGSVLRADFHLVLCRYLAFTYFEEKLQQEVLARLVEHMLPRGVLVIGKKERLPELPSSRAGGCSSLQPWFPELGIYRRRA